MNGVSSINLVLLCGVIGLSSGAKIFVGVNSYVNYDTAASGCRTLTGGQLATWGSQAEYDQIKAVRNSMNKDVWVGLNDMNDQGKWRFIDGDSSYCDDFDGTDCDNIPQWSDGEPNDAGTGEDVAELWSNGRLNDIYKTDSNAYVCEFNVDYVRTSDVGGYVPYETNPNNYYVLEFTSIQDMVTIFSILLNVVFITGWLCYATKAITNKASYSKVKMYATEDERL